MRGPIFQRLCKTKRRKMEGCSSCHNNTIDSNDIVYIMKWRHICKCNNLVTQRGLVLITRHWWWERNTQVEVVVSRPIDNKTKFHEWIFCGYTIEDNSRVLLRSKTYPIELDETTKCLLRKVQIYKIGDEKWIRDSRRIEKYYYKSERRNIKKKN